MKRREKVELIFIAVAVIAVGLGSRWFPTNLVLGELLAVGCTAWLVQGGLRDMWYLYDLKRKRSNRPMRKLACMCFESTAGFTGLLLGIALTFAGSGHTVELNTPRWMTLASAVFMMGFLVKDLVISWHPLGIQRDPDHHSIVFTWW